MLRFGNSKFSVEKNAENLACAIEQMIKSVPGKHKNIQVCVFAVCAARALCRPVTLCFAGTQHQDQRFHRDSNFHKFAGPGRRCHSCGLSIKVVKSNKINKNCRIFFLEECALGVIIFITHQRSKRLPSVTAGDAAEALETWTTGKTSDLRVEEGPPVNEASKES